MNSFIVNYIESLSNLRKFGSKQGDKEKFFGAIVLFIALSMGAPILLYLILFGVSVYGFYFLYRGWSSKDESDSDKIIFLNIQLIVIAMISIHFLFYFFLGL